MTDAQPSLDRVFDLLAKRRRRYALYYLEEVETAVVTLDDLADQLVEWEREWDEHDDHEQDDHREQVRVALHHNHLPRLADAGLVDYDPRSRTVRNWEDASLDQWIAADDEERDRLRAVFTIP